MPHIHKNIDFTISAFIVHNQHILFIDHKTLRKWLPIGGHIELDEDPQQALFREIEEEAGLKKQDLVVLSSKPTLEDTGVKFLYTPNYLDIHDISSSHKHIGLIYFLSSKTNKITLNKREHNNIKWFSKQELEEPKYSLSPATKFYAKQAFTAAAN